MPCRDSLDKKYGRSRVSATTEHREPPKQVEPIRPPLSPRELAIALVKYYDLHEGHFDLMLEFQIGIGPVGPNRESLSPGASIGVTRFGLTPSVNPGEQTVNAAEINPAPKKARSKPAAPRKKTPA